MAGYGDAGGDVLREHPPHRSAHVQALDRRDRAQKRADIGARFRDRHAVWIVVGVGGNGSESVGSGHWELGARR